MSLARMEEAQRSNQSKGRGWAFSPDPEPSLAEQILLLLTRPYTWVALGMLALSIYLLCAA